MPHVVTQACCGDASCVFACPVNAIHPTPDEADFGLAEMLYIDPVSCVDCGACVTACPVGAISAHDKLTDAQLPFVEVNAMFHSPQRSYPPQAPVSPVTARSSRDELRVAIVGAGPAALFAADELLKRPRVSVTVIDRLPTPHGLVRAGVAPDHPTTKTVEGLFGQIEDQDGFSYLLGVDVGVDADVSHDELLAHHHAVLYATGASQDRRLGIAGEDLAGSETATAFVAWYNGHPDHAGRTFDLSTERTVIIGNGNVALDVARILATDPDRLATTDIADHALSALRDSAVREIVLVGRRGAAHAAFTLPELVGLVQRGDIDIRVEGDDLLPSGTDAMADLKLDVLREAAYRPRRPGTRTIVFRFAASPLEIIGTDRVDGVRVCRNDLVADESGVVRAVPTADVEVLPTGVVLRSIGYRGLPVYGLPFDDVTATVPHESGRVVGRPGAYVAGWIKRGPNGFIGTNRSCAQETVDLLVADANAGMLASPIGSSRAFTDLVAARVADAIDLRGWRAIDRRERQLGRDDGRPRRKLVSREALLDAAVPEPPARGRGRRRVRR
ncbi:4Fe-4S binding protein [Aeromicrobium fastidiosum]|uniref:ferredoxin--NADP(+) reductase n=1 Tax=Aeromicrobium fastidiosum TaxID=52699 RepID=A0A641ANB5_9ACTN|nr:4Fe-4S binding protein [Aeromicrobium fastidiosum]KAA1376139.1 4Fe-4S dicluster domain-containing protein [Aeromicrobium fastidiosum]MBP2391980.1 ferredoxin--NADP+ reductase [Aeromicrobium fastidiosum]